MNGMFSEMTYFNAIPEKVEDMLKHYDEWGGPSTYPHMAAAGPSPWMPRFRILNKWDRFRRNTKWNGGALAESIKAKGEIRSQFTHVIDVAPTIYEVSGIPAPRVVNGIEQDPIEGKSFAYAFNDPKAPERHTVQYFEMFGNRAIYQDGWLARTIHRPAWRSAPLNSLQNDVWDLYDTRVDFSLANNLASKQPERLAAMQKLFMEEAEKYHVLPIDDRLLERTNAALVGRPTLMEGRTKMELHEGMKAMGVDVFIDLRNKSYRITADVVLDASGQGALVCQGGQFGGLSLFMKDGKPSFTYNFLGLESTTVESTRQLPPGKHSLVCDFEYDGNGPGKGGTITISANKEVLVKGKLNRTQPGIFSVDDLADIGVDLGTPLQTTGDRVISMARLKRS